MNAMLKQEVQAFPLIDIAFPLIDDESQSASFS
jgi:hypothetical protein